MPPSHPLILTVFNKINRSIGDMAEHLIHHRLFICMIPDVVYILFQEIGYADCTKFSRLVRIRKHPPPFQPLIIPYLFCKGEYSPALRSSHIHSDIGDNRCYFFFLHSMSLGILQMVGQSRSPTDHTCFFSASLLLFCAITPASG